MTRVRVALVAPAVVVVALLALLMLLPPPGGREPRTVRSDTGGFELVLPVGWRSIPHNVHDLANFERPLRLRVGSDAWMWVSRRSDGGVTVPDVQRRSSVWLPKEGRTDVRYRRSRVGEHEALRVDHREPGIHFGGVSVAPITVRRYQVPLGGQVFEIGISAWRGIPDDIDAAARRAVLFVPTKPERVKNADDAFALTLPAGWNQIEPESARTRLTALAPGTPTRGWIYVFRYDTSLEESVSNAERNIKAGGGTGLVRKTTTHRGAPAVRLDFEFPTSKRKGWPAMTHDVELFVARPGGGTLVVAVGHIDPKSRVADDVIATFRTLP